MGYLYFRLARVSLSLSIFLCFSSFLSAVGLCVRPCGSLVCVVCRFLFLSLFDKEELGVRRLGVWFALNMIPFEGGINSRTAG